MSEEALEEIKYYSEMYPDGIHKKSQAEEMFKELGYELVDTNSAGVKLTMISYYNFETTSSINFWSPINIDIDLQNCEHLTIKHIQAINKQIEELEESGWNNA